MVDLSTFEDAVLAYLNENGKTPLTLLHAEFITQQGWEPGIFDVVLGGLLRDAKVAETGGIYTILPQTTCFCRGQLRVGLTQ